MSLFSRLTDLPEGHGHARDDFDKRYHRTYMVYTNKDGAKEVVWYEGREGDIASFLKPDAQRFRINGELEAPIEPFMPKCGYYNVNGQPLFLIKEPKRQWKRSLSDSIYRVLDQNGVLERTAWWALAQGILNPEYVKLDEIGNKLFAHVALNDRFAISHTKKGTPSLIYRRYVVGELDFQSKQVKLVQPQLLQEVQDLFKYTGVKQWQLV